MLDNIVDRDHPRVVQPGRGSRLTGRPGHQLGAFRRGQLAGQQHLLDRYLAVKHLVVAAPHPPHAALTDRLGQPVPAANQNPHPTRHDRDDKREITHRNQ